VPTLTLPPAARWLHALGFDHDAADLVAEEESRLRASVPTDRADEAMAALWTSLGEARRAFVLSSRHADDLDALPTEATRWVWDAGFPRPHAARVEAAEDEQQLPRHYLFAIMRQESAFNDRDVSSARAIGLLQMIPPTTRRVAQTLGLPFREELLFQPAYNIRVGGWYIGRLFHQYRAMLPRAIGAFNAGPGAMGRWVRQWPDDEVDLFVERIPFDETRTYVRRVIQNLARYRYLYGPRDAGWPLRVDLRTRAEVDVLVDY
jgi:soluble lytic murein transglycosylase